MNVNITALVNYLTETSTVTKDIQCAVVSTDQFKMKYLRLVSNLIVHLSIFDSLVFSMPIAVAKRSKARVCGRSLVGIAGSNPAVIWTSVSCECCVLSGRGPEESYRLWCVIVCDLQASRKRQSWSALGGCARVKKIFGLEIRLSFSHI